MKSKKAGADVLNKYGWFNQYYALSGGDALKIKEVATMNVMEAMIFLCYDKDRNEVMSNMNSE